jgi:hypothetical protein
MKGQDVTRTEQMVQPLRPAAEARKLIWGWAGEERFPVVGALLLVFWVG